MEINWVISDTDISKLAGFINRNISNPEVSYRISRNIEHQNLELNQDGIIYSLLASLMVSHSKFGKILPVIQEKPFPFQYAIIANVSSIKEYILAYFKKTGITLDESRIPEFFATNFNLLDNYEWEILTPLSQLLYKKKDKLAERELADKIDTMFKGFGAIEARIFLQNLGLSKYEIPLDPVICEWFNNFGFPLNLSVTALQDRNYYHFVSDGIQLLCEKAGVYPCVLEAAIRSNCDKSFEFY